MQVKGGREAPPRAAVLPWRRASRRYGFWGEKLETRNRIVSGVCVACHKVRTRTLCSFGDLCLAFVYRFWTESVAHVGGSDGPPHGYLGRPFGPISTFSTQTRWPVKHRPAIGRWASKTFLYLWRACSICWRQRAAAASGSLSANWYALASLHASKIASMLDWSISRYEEVLRVESDSQCRARVHHLRGDADQAALPPADERESCAEYSCVQ